MHTESNSFLPRSPQISRTHRCRAVVVLLCTVQILVCQPARAGWRGKAWNEEKAPGFAPAAVVDPSGNTHIAVYDNDNLVLRHLIVSSQGKFLKTEVVDTNCGVAPPSIAADPFGHIHIVYASSDSPTPKLRYAFFDGKSWTTQEIEDGGSSASVTLDPSGLPHIANIIPSGVLHHDYYDGTTWVLETTGLNATGYGTSIALDNDGAVHVVFTDSTSRALWHAVKTGAGWNADQIASSPIYQLISPTLAIGPASDLHVLFLKNGEWEIDYASYSGATWSNEVVASNANEGSLAIDQQGAPKVSYTGIDGEPLFYATRGAGGWAAIPIGGKEIPADPIFFSTAIALDKAGLPHIAAQLGPEQPYFDLIYEALYEPDLRCGLQNIAVKQLAGGRFKLSGTRRIQNYGSLNSRSTRVTSYLSTDALLDSGDTLLGTQSVGSIAPSRSNNRSFSFTLASSPSGQFLINSITPPSGDPGIADKVCVASIP